MEWWWYPLIALGALVGIGGLVAIFAPGNRPALEPMGRHWVLPPPEPPKPRKR